MKTSVEYLALCQRYRIAKLSSRNPADRDYLEALENSYYTLVEKRADTYAFQSRAG